VDVELEEVEEGIIDGCKSTIDLCMGQVVSEERGRWGITARTQNETWDAQGTYLTQRRSRARGVVLFRYTLGKECIAVDQVNR